MSSKGFVQEDYKSSLRFIIPYRRQWEVVIFHTIAVVLVLGIVFYQSYLDDMNFMFLAALFFFSPFVFLYIIDMLWLLLGKEVVEVNKNRIVINHQVFGISLPFSKFYEAKNINGVFFSQKDHVEPTILYIYIRGINFLNFSLGKIVINSGSTFLGFTDIARFGSSLEDWEAQDILRTIHVKFPRYIYFPPENTGYR
jgi:hypothetical protein